MTQFVRVFVNKEYLINVANVHIECGNNGISFIKPTGSEIVVFPTKNFGEAEEKFSKIVDFISAGEDKVFYLY